MRHCHVRADITVVGKVTDEVREILRPDFLRAIVAVEAVALQPIAVEFW